MAFLFGPSMIVAPLGGVLADRVDKRRTLIIVNVVAMLQASVLFGLTLTGVVEIWHLYALALVAGVVGAIEMPLRQAFVAELVPREDLVNAIALSLDLVQPVARHRSGDRRPDDRGLRRGQQLRHQRAELRVGASSGCCSSSPIGCIAPKRPEVFPSVRASLAEGLRYARRRRRCSGRSSCWAAPRRWR